MNIPIEDLMAFIKKYENNAAKAFYPEDPYSAVQLRFENRLSTTDRRRITDIVDYWGSIPYVGVVYGVSMVGNNVLINVAEEESTSSNPRKYDPLTKLADWIQNGTPKRKDNTQAIEPVENRLMNVWGLDNVL